MILKNNLALSVRTGAIAQIIFLVMGKLVYDTTAGIADKMLWMADKAHGLVDLLLRPNPAA